MCCRGWLRTTLGGLVALAAVAAAVPVCRDFALYYHERYTQPRIWAARQAERMSGYRSSSLPLVAALANSHIAHGHSMDELLRHYPPIRRHGYAGRGWFGAEYEWPGDGRTLYLIGRDGVLVSAQMHVPIAAARGHLYLDHLIPMTPAERAALNASGNDLKGELALLGSDDGRDAGHAVAGAVASLHFDEWFVVARQAH